MRQVERGTPLLQEYGFPFQGPSRERESDRALEAHETSHVFFFLLLPESVRPSVYEIEEEHEERPRNDKDGTKSMNE